MDSFIRDAFKHHDNIIAKIYSNSRGGVYGFIADKFARLVENHLSDYEYVAGKLKKENIDYNILKMFCNIAFNENALVCSTPNYVFKNRPYSNFTIATIKGRIDYIDLLGNLTKINLSKSPFRRQVLNEKYIEDINSANEQYYVFYNITKVEAMPDLINRYFVRYSKIINEE